MTNTPTTSIATATTGTTTTTTTATRTPTRTKVKELHGENQALKLAGDEKSSTIQALESRVQLLDKSLSEHKSHIQRMERKNRTLEETLERAHGAEEEEKQQLDRFQKRLEVAQQELERRDVIIATLKQRLDHHLQTELAARANHDAHDSAMQEAILNQVEHQVSLVAQEHEGVEARLRHENVTLQASLNEHQRAMNTVDAEKSLLERKGHTMAEQQQELVERNRRLEYEVQRKEHDVNVWKAKCEEIKLADPTEQFQAEISKLKRTIEGCRHENDRLQRLWMKSQQDLHSCQALYNQLTREHNFMKVGVVMGRRFFTPPGSLPPFSTRSLPYPSPHL